MKKALLVVLILFLFFSCSVKQKIYLDKNTEGNCRLDLKFDKVFVDYIQFIYEIDGVENAKVFDEAAIRKAFNEFSNLSLNKIEVVSDDALYLDFSFNDLDSTFSENSAVVSPISYTKKGEDSIFKIQLDRSNHDVLVNKVLGISGMEGFLDYIQELVKPDTKANVIDNYDYIFGDLLVERSIEEVLDASFVNLEFSVNGNITSYTGGEKKGNIVLYKIPLMDFLTLEKPVHYEIVFK